MSEGASRVSSALNWNFLAYIAIFGVEHPLTFVHCALCAIILWKELGSIKSYQEALTAQVQGLSLHDIKLR